MKNIQVIDGADNCTYSFFAAADEEFDAIFPDGTDVAFVENFFDRVGEAHGAEITGGIWARPVKKRDVQRIHGTLFCEQLYNEGSYYYRKKVSKPIPLAANFSTPPENAYDPNGPFAPGLPGEDVGYIPPEGGPSWVPNPNPRKGGSNHGWLDSNERVWCPTGPGPGGLAHGCPHWDVVMPSRDNKKGEGNRNVFPRKR